MVTLKKTNLVIFILLVFFLLITKIDYRTLEPESYHSHDDASYYFHAYTLGLDFDLDYSNQISEENNFYKNKEKKLVPTHPIGAGFFASPFVIIGNFIQKIFFNNSDKSVIYFFYSLSSITYFFLSLNLINLTITKLNIPFNSNFNNLLMLLGSGIAYFSFERFGMTAVYEVFAVSLLMYLSSLFNKKVYFIVGFLSIFLLIIRWVNYFYILIPFFVFFLSDKEKLIKIYLFKNVYYLLGVFLGIISFLLHTHYLYGFLSFNPGKIDHYGTSSSNLIQYYLDSSGLDSFYSFDNFINIIEDFILILFSKEFGLFWFSPVLFFMFYIAIKLAFKKEVKLFILIFFIFTIPLGIVICWQSVASSYGYRYLYSLIPIAIILANSKLNKTESKILKILSILSIVLLLLFETNQYTSLSQQVNTFGVYSSFTAPNYLSGAFLAIKDLDTYAKIVGSSFVSVLSLKLFFTFFEKNMIISFLDKLGYLNEDVIRLLEYTENTSYIELIALIMLLLFFIFKLAKNTIKLNESSI